MLLFFDCLTGYGRRAKRYAISERIKGEYRTVSHSVNYEVLKNNAQAILENKVIRKKRGAIREHPFGTVKHNMRFVQFLTRGNTKVSGEAALLFITYNLKRLRNITEDPENIGKICAQACILRTVFASIAIAKQLFREFQEVG